MMYPVMILLIAVAGFACASQHKLAKSATRYIVSK